MENKGLPFSLQELCHATELPTQAVIDIVEQGIIEPQGSSPDSWVFSVQMLIVVKKAQRLHQDLGVDWSGIALALCLLEELEQLREENRRLQCQLGKFILD